MPVETLTAVPHQLEQGSTWSFTDSNTLYPNTLWTALLVLWRADGSEPKTIAGTNSGTKFLFTATPSVSAQIAPGVWNWIIYVTETSSGQRIAAASGQVTVIPDLAKPLAATESQKQLTNLQKTILDLTSKKFSSSAFNGQQQTLADLPALKRLEVQLRAEVIQERNAIMDAMGIGSGNFIEVQFA